MSSKSEVTAENGESKICNFTIDNQYSWDLLVPKTVYPPKEDTEMLARAIIELKKKDGLAVEIGCGSGAISLLLANLGWKVVSCDVNPIAVAAARGNIANYGFQNMVEVIEGGIGDGFKIPKEADLIIWNLPYISPDWDPSDGEQMELELIEEAAMVDRKNGWGSELLKEIEGGGGMNPNLMCLVVFRTDPVSPSKPKIWVENGWSARSVKFVRMGSERIDAIALWRTGSGLEPKSIKDCSSTMDEAFKLPKSKWSRLIAERQTSGRGRRGSEWHSKRGDLLATWRIGGEVLSHISPGLLQICVGSIVADSVNATVKWPNDILAPSGKKIGGILIESRDGEGVAIGIGLNKLGKGRSDFSSAGWNETIGEIDAKDLFQRIDSGLSGLFEDNGWTLAPCKDHIREISWKSLSGFLSIGTEIEYCGGRYRPIGISMTGEIEVIGEMGEMALSDLDFIDWKASFLPSS